LESQTMQAEEVKEIWNKNFISFRVLSIFIIVTTVTTITIHCLFINLFGFLVNLRFEFRASCLLGRYSAA
jgi:hypothetical protein